VRIQLWSYNYAPEPTGIAPISRRWAEAMQRRGHDVLVVAAHPHYPSPDWGTRTRPYRERRDGVPVLRLPLRVGRSTTRERLVQEASFAAALSAAAPLLPVPDVVVAVSPSFPALVPAMAFSRVRRVPWVMWLQDILPDGAAVTGMLPEGRLLSGARALERAAYASAARVVVISESFAANLGQKGVPAAKLRRIFNPATIPIRERPRAVADRLPARVLTMGNIGHTQNLAAVARAFEASDELRRRGATLHMAGDGVAADDVRAAVRTDRVRITGVLGPEELERELAQARVALVSQSYDGIDFNVPSKLMNFMGQGIATVGAVRGESEVARLIRESGGGWVHEAETLDGLGGLLASCLDDPAAIGARDEAALRFARREFACDRMADQFESVLAEVVPRGR
jgi:colanic acid biosynthesis glycosyl transferase WcaI